MNDSPSLLLQRAADKLSERASAATSGPWQVGPNLDSVEPVTEYYDHKVAYDILHEEDADWIAMLSPVVAAPLVAWLRSQAQLIQRQWYPGSPSYEPWPVMQFARLVLGEPRPGSAAVSAEGKERSDP